MQIRIDIGAGELIDKITILQIKTAHVREPTKLRNIRHELGVLQGARNAHLSTTPALDVLTEMLREVNRALWDIEDEIRDCERAGTFGPRFVELARAVYITNDRRAAIKREINDLTGSSIVEEKAYAAY